MKKALYILTAVLLVGVVLSGCGKKDNPFEPNTDSYNGMTAAISSKGPQVVVCEDLSGNNIIYHTPAYDEIGIVFDSDIMPSTIDTHTVQLRNVENMAAPLAYTVSYDVKTKKATIKITGNWEDNKSYMVTVTKGVKDLRGNTLDGNGNDDNQDPQDNYHMQFWGATSTVATYNFTGPQAGVYPANNTLAFSLSDSIMITITDYGTPVDSIDPSSLDISDFSLTTEAGVNVPLTWTTPEEITTPQRSYRVKFKPTLAQATNYIFTVKASGIKDIHGNSLDGDTDGLSEKDLEDNVVVRFRTFDPYPTSILLRVREAYFTDNGENLMVNFTRKMNVATLTSANIKIFNNNDYTGFVPGTIKIFPDSMGFSYSLENLPAGTNYLWISRNVSDTGGYKLDQNLNYFGGEEANVFNGYISDDFFDDLPYDAGLVKCLFDDNVENGSNGWSAQRLWHRSTRRASPTWGGIYSWHCGVDADSSYLVAGPTAVNDTLFLPTINCIPYTNGVRIVYHYWSRTDGGADAMRVIYSTDNGANWNLVNGSAVYFGNQSSWDTNEWWTLPGAANGQMVRIAFAFNTDATGNVYPSEGPYVDNIRVYAW